MCCDNEKLKREIEKVCPPDLIKCSFRFLEVRDLVGDHVKLMAAEKVSKTEITSDSDGHAALLESEEDLFHQGRSVLKQVYDRLKKQVEEKIDEHTLATMNELRKELCHLIGVPCNGRLVLERDTDTDNRAAKKLEDRVAELEEELRTLKLSKSVAEKEEAILQKALEVEDKLNAELKASGKEKEQGEETVVPIEEETKAEIEADEDETEQEGDILSMEEVTITENEGVLK